MRGAPESSWGLKPTKPVPKSGQLVPKPAQPVPKAAQLVPKAAQLVPKAAQLVAKSANLIGLRKVSRPKVCPIFKTPDQPPKRPGMLGGDGARPLAVIDGNSAVIGGNSAVIDSNSAVIDGNRR